MDRIENNINDTYEIRTPNGIILKVDKKTNKIHFTPRTKPAEVGKYREIQTQALLEANAILMDSPYKDYKPKILNPELKAGQNSTLLEFKRIQSYYYKEPPIGKVAPWTKKEKAYYESLKTKRERYKYLLIRSGLRSGAVNIPYQAYCNIDENSNLINPNFAEIYEEVDENRGTLGYGYLPLAEWELAAGLLGDVYGIGGATAFFNTGFKARGIQVYWIYMQVLSLSGVLDNYEPALALGYGLVGNLKKQNMLKKFEKNPPYDKFKMLPYLDEMIGVDWVMDFNEHLLINDAGGDALSWICQKIEKGELLDPRDIRATSDDRIAFDKQRKTSDFRTFDMEKPNEWSVENMESFKMHLRLQAGIATMTPHQSYPNAPIYATPEYLQKLYDDGKFDAKKWDITIPAIYREHFPQYLRDEIEAFAKKHNIRD